MESCCASLVKYFMVICNCLFALIGCVLIGFGAYTQIESKDYLNFLGDNYVNTPIFIIILGGVIFVISFFGCCGACNESKCMMYTYGFLLFIILIAQIGAGIAAFALKGDLENKIEENMVESLPHYIDTPEFTTTWDLVQQNLECCGVQNYTDWAETFKPNRTVPDSCCKGEHEDECGVNYDVQKIYTEGCFSKFSQEFKDNLNIVGAVAVGVALAELMTVALAYCLGKRMGESGQFV